MKTEVIMKRVLFDTDIRQKSQSEFLSARDLENAGNHYRACQKMSRFNLDVFLKNKSTLEFIQEIEKEFECKAVIKSEKRGRNGTTWVHPLLFIDIALAISPKLKIEVYKWMYDLLLKYRNSSGESYKIMCGAISKITFIKRDISKNIIDTANKIKNSLGVEDWNIATEKQLEKRDKIQNNISILSNVLRDLDRVVELAIKQEIG